MQDATTLFKKHFNQTPTHLVQAPGRLEVLGNHTDYNEGLVLSLAISYGTTITAKANGGDDLNLYAREFDRKWSGKVNAVAPQDQETWTNYILGVIAQLQKRGVTVGGADLAMAGFVEAIKNVMHASPQGRREA